MKRSHSITQEQDSVVYVFSIIPIDSLLDECEEEEHEIYLEALKNNYREIGCEINNYFHGNEMFVGIEDRLNKQEIQFLKNDVSRYIALYGLIQFGWQYIKKEIIDILRKCGIDRETEQKLLKPITPGVFFGIVLSGESISRFLIIKSTCFEFIARNEYKKLLRKPGIDKEVYKGVSDNNLTILNALKKIVESSDRYGEEYNLLYGFVLYVAEKNANKIEIKERYREYMKIVAESETLEKKWLHPRRKPASLKIINQKLIYPFC